MNPEEQILPWLEIYLRLTQECGIVTLSEWSQIEITGSDRVSFLHNMCTNDIRRLSPGQCCEAFCTDVKGKIQAHIYVFVEDDRLTLLTVPGQTERILTHLERYIIREDVELSDCTGKQSWALVVGPEAKTRLQSSSDHNANLPREDFTHTLTSISDQMCLVAQLLLLWPGGFLLRTQDVESLCSNLSIPAIDTTSPAWTALRVESQLPLFGTDFDETNLPQEGNRDERTISFTKGCYLGQETVARIDALGHVNKKLVLLSLVGQSVPSPGTKLTRGAEEVGTITTGTWSPRISRLAALAFVKRGANDEGSQLDCDGSKAVVEVGH